MDAIDETYNQADEDRNCLEKSLANTSSELSSHYQELRRRICELEVTRKELERSLSILNATLESTGEGIIVINNNSEVVTCNQQFINVWRIPTELLIKGSSYDILESCAGLTCEPEDFFYRMKVVEEDEHLECDVELIELKDGRILERHSKPQLLSGKLLGRVWCFRDVTDMKRNEALVHHQAHHDALTGLPNRLLFNDRLEHAVHIAKRSSSNLAVCFLDLDGFKYINDSSGHHVGDKILCGVADRIQSSLREQDTVARLGGDEYIILMEGLNSPKEAMHVAQRIMRSFERPFMMADQMVYMSCSIGISVYPLDTDKPDKLIRNADLAMYDAKAKGKNNIQLFNPQLEAIVVKRVRLETELRNAVSNGDFLLLYQPKTNIALDKIVGLEALIRWRHQSLGTIPPNEFIPLAEETGLIIDIGEWIIHEVCRQLTVWQQQGLDVVPVAINMSVRELQQKNICTKLLEIIREYDLPVSCVNIEITESLLMDNLDKAIRTLEGLRDAGFMISVDDFGTGHSSLGYLKYLPVNTLKVDRAFIKDIAVSKKDAAIANSIISLGHNLGLDVVAEGVEDQISVDILKDFSCDQIQGYFFSAPVPGEKITDMLLKYSK